MIEGFEKIDPNSVADIPEPPTKRQKVEEESKVEKKASQDEELDLDELDDIMEDLIDDLQNDSELGGSPPCTPPSRVAPSGR